MVFQCEVETSHLLLTCSLLLRSDSLVHVVLDEHQYCGHKGETDEAGNPVSMQVVRDSKNIGTDEKSRCGVIFEADGEAFLKGGSMEELYHP